MASPIPIDGDVLRDLRRLRGLSQEELARGAGLDRAQISRYERGPQQPPPAHLKWIIAALERIPVSLEQRALIKTPALDAALERIENLMNRRQLAKLAAAGTTVVILPPTSRRQALPPPRLLHEHTLALAGRYLTTAPVELLPEARHHLDVLTDALGRPLAGERNMLLVDAAETASLAARCAQLAGHKGQANAFCGHAQQLGDRSGYATLRGLTRIAAAAAHRPLIAGGDGDWVTALQMVNSAVPLIGTSGPGAKWAQYILAEVYADLSRDHDSRTMLELAQATPGDDHGDGFFSTRARFGHGVGIASWEAGRCAALLGRSDEALALFADFRAASRLATTPWDAGADQVDLALAYACAGEPEPMCDAGHAALDLSVTSGIGLLVAEIRGVRGKLPDPCADVECVRELDERLLTL